MSRGVPARPIPTFRIARFVFLRGLAVVYALAFGSLGVQVAGLVGPDGIVPAAEYLAFVEERLGAESYRRLPTLFWLVEPAAAALEGACYAGVALSVVLFFGVAPRLVLGLLWALYLSLFSVGQEFLGFQWDSLLLETGLLAVVLAPGGLRPRLRRERDPSWIALGLLWFLLFRLMAGSGLVKVLTDEAWRDFEALRYHFLTQPLPTPIAWYADKLPGGLLSLATFVTLVVELVLPLLMVGIVVERCAPRPVLRLVRVAVFAGFTLFMVAIALTGNYGFFNVLTLVLALLLLDDAVYARLLPRSIAWRIEREEPAGPTPLATIGLAAAAIPLVMLASTEFLVRALPSPELPAPVTAVRRAVAPFACANAYGLFARMTRSRPEITLEASVDGESWVPYRFRHKPGPLDRAPSFVAPHMPRLDWQMWFAALELERSRTVRAQGRWFVKMLLALFEREPAVLALFAADPLDGRSPRFLRATIAQYSFTDTATRRETGRWWERTEPRVFLLEERPE